jgi:hypothetical protein
MLPNCLDSKFCNRILPIFYINVDDYVYTMVLSGTLNAELWHLV